MIFLSDLIIATGSTALLSLFFTPLIIRFAHHINFIDIPDGRIKLHTYPVAYLGGLAWYLSLIIGILYVAPIHRELIIMVGVSGLLFCLGLWDDAYALRASVKFGVQLLIAMIFACFGYFIYLPQGSFVVHQLLMLFWFMSMINAWNLIDVMDGLCLTTAIGVMSILVCISLYTNFLTGALVGACAIGSALGVLRYNWPSARVYLGDAGSLAIGGFVLSFVLVFPYAGTLPLEEYWRWYVAAMGIMAIPAWEVTALVIVRALKGIPIYKGSRDHFSHYLKDRGWSVKEILILVTCFQAIQGLIAFSFMMQIISFISFILAAVGLCVAWVILCGYSPTLFKSRAAGH